MLAKSSTDFYKKLTHLVSPDAATSLTSRIYCRYRSCCSPRTISPLLNAHSTTLTSGTHLVTVWVLERCYYVCEHTVRRDIHLAYVGCCVHYFCTIFSQYLLYRGAQNITASTACRVQRALIDRTYIAIMKQYYFSYRTDAVKPLRTYCM